MTLHKVYFYREYYVSGLADYTTDDGDASYTIDLFFFLSVSIQARAVGIWCGQ